MISEEIREIVDFSQDYGTTVERRLHELNDLDLNDANQVG
jgi:hypothetical protein